MCINLSFQVFPTLKIINYYCGSHQNAKATYLIVIEQPRIFLLNFTRYFRLKLNCTSKKPKEKNGLGRRKLTGKPGCQMHK